MMYLCNLRIWREGNLPFCLPLGEKKKTLGEKQSPSSFSGGRGAFKEELQTFIAHGVCEDEGTGTKTKSNKGSDFDKPRGEPNREIPSSCRLHGGSPPLTGTGRTL